MITRTAVDGHLAVLNTVETRPDFVFSNALPFGPAQNIDSMLPDIIVRTQDYYLPLEGVLREENHLYLSKLNK